MEAAEQQFHVLAVDDSLVDRKLIERLLRTSSYQVTTVDSANKALEFLGIEEEEQIQMEQDPISLFSRKKDVQVNLVITDYCMPGMTGYDLLRKIKESSFLRNIPVVIMSSENVPSRIKRCLEEGAEEFLLKPVRLPDVNKLKPHILRAKYEGKGQEELKQHHDDIKIAAQQQLQLQQQSEPQQMQQQQLHPQQEQHKNYKRKSLEEGIPVERTSHRYSGPGLAVA